MIIMYMYMYSIVYKKLFRNYEFYIPSWFVYRITLEAAVHQKHMWTYITAILGYKEFREVLSWSSLSSGIFKTKNHMFCNDLWWRPFSFSYLLI